MFRRLLITVTIFLFCFIQNSSGQEKSFIDQMGNLRMENDYIAIFVNQSKENLGRFAIDVTGGNPLLIGDNNKPLIYGHPQPWTSYTTIRINDNNYIFGGSTNKRAGLEENYGKIITPPQVVGNDKIITKVAFDKIEITQELSFMESTTTGFPDTARIKYIATNTGKVNADIGIRIMLDTMLGANDGAPFRVLNKTITTDTLLVGSEIPDFWQAFDSLQSPMVMAQGGLAGNGLTTPDKIYFTNWGSLADGPWDFSFRSGKEFVREGEFELDSAIALFWQPQQLKPGETKVFATSYGLSGITIVPGLLALGLTSPAKVVFDQIRSSFPIVAYIENTSKFTAKDVKVSLNLPKGFIIKGETNNKTALGNLGAGECLQIAWQIEPTSYDGLPEDIFYEVQIEASNTDGNLAKRNVSFISPPFFETYLSGPKELELKNYVCYPNPFDVLGIIKNIGGAPSYDTGARLVLPPGLSPAHNDRIDILLGNLEPNEEVVIKWRIETLGIQGDVPYALEVYSLNTPSSIILETISIPKAAKSIYLAVDKESISVGDFFTVKLMAAGIPDFASFKMNLKYSNDSLEPMFVSRGNAFLTKDEYLPFTLPDIDRAAGTIEGFQGQLLNGKLTSDVLASIHFYALQEGLGTVEIGYVEILNKKGEIIHVIPVNLTINIE